MRILKTFFLLNALLTINLGFSQINDSIGNSIMEKLKSEGILKETIYEFKGKELPEFELMQSNGKKLKSEALKGKPTLINFWFSNCAPCIEEMPLLNEIKKQFDNEANFISITFQSSDEVKEFLNKKKFDFTHLVDSREYLNIFGFFAYPKTLILDKNLIIVGIEKMIPKDAENQAENKEKFMSGLINQLLELKKR